ncbi:dTMP kinase [Pediococcus ethanolidurans]|uniref:dTMP kinase n=1 Tax=Pediococcus ethanolidurans TaxID=319653 RepID=UPI001C1EA489|nr:dTMP kinase [Pediococcus ethanolidurans]MBU7555193.1 dTMP kinase [Pediococcus ethanolidurans]MBU7562829.1 dTMP kinase [Pediococcus ethanolidurans]MCV3314788.1 dTMP kinase [Pediococcus ethanolidurans]MCV3322768.1 dTMP kinase [Pediococcus ethanolidurans]MCV3326683.1 dTMP kinase [Pediococcus ethanolidurans]
MIGKFISFEGPDGAGKTTALNSVVADLTPQLKNMLVVTREPGGNRISEAIRNIILDRKNTEMDDRTEALLYAAARRQHIVETIQPALDSGKLVLCDRYVDSSVAYQGAGRQIGVDEVYQMNLFATAGLLPDLTIYFDIPSEIGLQRIMTHRTDEINRLDVEQLSFHKRVRASYLKIAEQNPQRIKVIDATQSKADVVSNVEKIIYQENKEFFK